jgi:hypothetical protein
VKPLGAPANPFYRGKLIQAEALNAHDLIAKLESRGKLDRSGDALPSKPVHFTSKILIYCQLPARVVFGDG